jgi:hypothetical protein
MFLSVQTAQHQRFMDKQERQASYRQVFNSLVKLVSQMRRLAPISLAITHRRGGRWDQVSLVLDRDRHQRQLRVKMVPLLATDSNLALVKTVQRRVPQACQRRSCKALPPYRQTRQLKTQP